MNEPLSLDPADVRIGSIGLQGILAVPAKATGIIIFAHGSGSGRLSPRNNRVAAALRSVGLATLLLDLLTPVEGGDRSNVFDIDLLASRLVMATDWVRLEPRAAGLIPGYFGASTGAAAALKAAAVPSSPVGAIVSRGGRPDLALDVLAKVHAPTLLIVGGLDGPVIDLNRRAYQALRCRKKIVIVEGAGHLFEEPGTLEEVISHANLWFQTYLRPNANRS